MASSSRDPVDMLGGWSVGLKAVPAALCVESVGDNALFTIHI